MNGIANKLRAIADASRREDGADIPLGEHCRAAATEIERAHAALAIAREALERCYNVTTYPASGESPQDKAIAAIDAALTPSPAYRPQDGEGA